MITPVKVYWTHQPTKWVNDTLGGSFRDDGPSQEREGILVGLTSIDRCLFGVVLWNNRFHEIEMSELGSRLEEFL